MNERQMQIAVKEIGINEKDFRILECNLDNDYSSFQVVTDAYEECDEAMQIYQSLYGNLITSDIILSSNVPFVITNFEDQQPEECVMSEIIYTQAIKANKLAKYYEIKRDWFYSLMQGFEEYQESVYNDSKISEMRESK